MENNEIYIKFRKSLDSYRDVLLAEIQLIEDEKDKEQFAVTVTNKIVDLLKDNATNRKLLWRKQNAAQAQKFIEHANQLLSNKVGEDCPPGFEFKDGICVRI